MKPNKALSVAAIAVTGAFSTACGGGKVDDAPQYNDYNVTCYDSTARRGDSLNFQVSDYTISPNGTGAQDDTYTLLTRQEGQKELVKIGTIAASHCDVTEATTVGKAPVAEDFSAKGGYNLYCTDPESNEEFLSLKVFKVAASRDNSRYEASLGGEKLGNVSADNCSFDVIKATAGKPKP